MSGNWDEVVTR
jgi:hypothetical protein